MSKIFSEEISSVIAEGKGSLTAKILYEMCDERLHPWGGEGQLAEKLRIICGVFGLTLRESFLCYGRTERGSRHRSIDAGAEIAAVLEEDPAYRAFVQKIASLPWAFAFDGGEEDLEHFCESVELTLELNGLIDHALSSFDEKNRQPERDRSDNYALCSLLLHLHRPAAFFPFSREIRDGMAAFIYAGGCRMGEAVLEGEDRCELRSAYRAALQQVHADKTPFTKQGNFVLSAALGYALCRYLLRHGIAAQDLPPIAIAAALAAKLRRVKTQEEIQALSDSLKPDMPIEEVRLACCDAVEFEQVFAAYCARNQK